MEEDHNITDWIMYNTIKNVILKLDAGIDPGVPDWIQDHARFKSYHEILSWYNVILAVAKRVAYKGRLNLRDYYRILDEHPYPTELGKY